MLVFHWERGTNRLVAEYILKDRKGSMGSFPSVTITQLLPDWANEVAKIEGTSFVKMKGDSLAAAKVSNNA